MENPATKAALVKLRQFFQRLMADNESELKTPHIRAEDVDVFPAHRMPSGKTGYIEVGPAQLEPTHEIQVGPAVLEPEYGIRVGMPQNVTVYDDEDE